MEQIFYNVPLSKLKPIFKKWIKEAITEIEPPHPDQSAPQDEILTTKQAADFLHITVQTLYSYVSKRRIASCKRGKHLYFIKSDLIEFVKSGRQKTVSEIETEADNNLIKRNKNGAK